MAPGFSAWRNSVHAPATPPSAMIARVARTERRVRFIFISVISVSVAESHGHGNALRHRRGVRVDPDEVSSAIGVDLWIETGVIGPEPEIVTGQGQDCVLRANSAEEWLRQRIGER